METVKEGRQTPDGLGPVVDEGLYIRVIFGDPDAGVDILHVDVLEEEAAHIMAAVAVGVDADAVVGAFEVDALSPDGLGAGRQFAADGRIRSR